MKIRQLAAAAFLLSLFSSNAWAGLSKCTVSSTPVSFGIYNVFSSVDLLSTGSVTLSNCIGSGTAQVSLSTGQHSTSFTTRALLNTGGSDLLDYNLYLDAALTAVWGDGTGGSNVWLTTGNSSHTVFGKIPAGQSGVSVGTYGDSVGVTINF